MDYKVITAADLPTFLQKNEIANFLAEHLDEFGDSKHDIMKCLDYALSSYGHQGGFVLLATEDDAIAGVVVMNKTGMESYIPENILVYIAVHKEHRGKGLGKALMQRAIATAKGSIALHVEPNNPAKKLYEKLGFTNKYLEMRLQR
ncbi:GNAT family N-acetyltransferase [Cesiribacter sp. SM1]|uniref:GNAT family N-acetyltransferase n=1 Tax=Cesiribacter sp. SM1 TaxID=2861196 RepID=UPI001CD29841|nr:GNAT family N-acetyltransferase [Cesiribacter sp. SM1]